MNQRYSTMFITSRIYNYFHVLYKYHSFRELRWTVAENTIWYYDKLIRFFVEWQTGWSIDYGDLTIAISTCTYNQNKQDGWFAPLISKVITLLLHRRPMLTLSRLLARRLFISMMTSSNANAFRVTGPLWGEYTGDRWIALRKSQ